jgi:hypothetical protein
MEIETPEKPIRYHVLIVEFLRPFKSATNKTSGDIRRQRYEGFSTEVPNCAVRRQK